jgi:hypothetical protein
MIRQFSLIAIGLLIWSFSQFWTYCILFLQYVFKLIVWAFVRNSWWTVLHVWEILFYNRFLILSFFRCENSSICFFNYLLIFILKRESFILRRLLFQNTIRVYCANFIYFSPRITIFLAQFRIIFIIKSILFVVTRLNFQILKSIFILFNMNVLFFHELNPMHFLFQSQNFFGLLQNLQLLTSIFDHILFSLFFEILKLWTVLITNINKLLIKNFEFFDDFISHSQEDVKFLSFKLEF